MLNGIIVDSSSTLKEVSIPYYYTNVQTFALLKHKCMKTSFIHAALDGAGHTVSCPGTIVPQTFIHPRHTLICQTHDGTPQNIASRKGGTKLYEAINMYLSIRILAYENKTWRMLNKTMDDER
jgi:hypothetical protein